MHCYGRFSYIDASNSSSSVFIVKAVFPSLSSFPKATPAARFISRNKKLYILVYTRTSLLLYGVFMFRYFFVIRSVEYFFAVVKTLFYELGMFLCLYHILFLLYFPVISPIYSPPGRPVSHHINIPIVDLIRYYTQGVHHCIYS